MADIPKIRFKGFTEPWEQRKLGEIVDICSGRDYKHLEEGDIPVYGTGGYMLSVSEALSNEKDAIGIGRKGTIDKPYILKAPFWTVDTLFYCIPREKYHLDFAYDIFQNIDWRLMDESTGVPSLSKTAINAVNVLVPNEEEQLKIGEYFRTLDHLITLHQRKYFIIYNKLITWEQRKLGEVLKERTERAKGDEELLSVTIANGVIRQIDSEKRNTASEDRSNYKIVKKGDVPYNSMRMWQGAVGNSKYNGIVSPAYTILTPTSEANGKFFMELFKKKSTLQIFQRWSQGLTSDTWNLKYPILSSIQFAIPSVEEQEKIAEYFSSLDHLITLHRRAL